MAAEGGALGALNSEGEALSSLILFPTYILAYLAYGETPAEVNINILSAFGLDDEYRIALRDSNFVAGKYGGQAGMTYISLASFFKGLPSLSASPISINVSVGQNNGAFAYTVLSLPGIQVVGGSGELLYVGTAGMFPTYSMMSGNDDAGSGGGTPQYSKLSNGEINRLKKAGIDIHELKGGDGASKYDLYKDRYGNIYIKRKFGIGPGEDTGLNINDY